MSWCVVAGPRVCNSISYLAMNSKTVRVVAFGVEQSKLTDRASSDALYIVHYSVYTFFPLLCQMCPERDSQNNLLFLLVR